MDNQRFTLLVTLVSSVTVVLISSAANIWSKWIDTKQKDQDRALEFNKIYAARKIEAAQDIIGRNNLLIAQARHLNEIMTAYVENYGYYYKGGTVELEADMEKVNNLIVTDKATYRLYFEADEQSEAISKAALVTNQMLSNLLSRLEARKSLIDKADNDNVLLVKKENAQKWNDAQKDLENLLVEYHVANSAFQLSLKNSCAYFREQLRKYDIKG